MKLLVLGAGAWGTALAASAARRHGTTLWARDAAQARALQGQHRNERYLPGIELPGALRIAVGDPVALAQASDLVVVATPMAGLRPMLQALEACSAPVAWLCKGFEAGAAGLLGHEV